MTLADLIGKLIDSIWAFLPFAIVHEWEAGARVRLGSVKENVGTGLVWRWPFIDDVVTVDSNLQVVSTHVQTVIGQDGRVWSFSLGISYEVVDAVAYHTSIQDHDSTVVDQVRAVAASWVGSVDDPDVLLAEEIKAEAEGRLEDWGIELVGVRFLDLAPMSALRLIGGGMGGF